MDLPGAGGAGPWQVIGALAAVFGLLLLVLRGLQRWQPSLRGDAAVRVLSVRRLGPRREVQEVRVGDTVHTLYRQEGALVVLASKPWREHPACRGAAERETIPAAPRLLALLAAAGGRARRSQVPPGP